MRPPHEGLRYDFRPGVPDVREFPREGWSRAARRLYPIGTCWQHRPKRERQGLVLGYAHLTEREIADGVTAGLP